MAGPKTRTTKARRGNRRSHHHAEGLESVKCSNCGELKQSHIVCPACGYYSKREVIKKNEL